MPINNSDFIPVGLTGNVVISSKVASFAKTIVNDATTEGAEKFVAKLRKDSPTGNILAQSNIVLVNDTSQVSPLPSYSLSVNPDIVNEGSNVIFVLTSVNVPDGTAVPYTISGTAITVADIDNQSLTGNFIVDANGVATKTIPISADLTTEGYETLIMTLDNVDPEVAVSVLINDVSNTLSNIPSYSLSASVSSVNETTGTNSFTINLLTNNVPPGTAVPYTITGVSSSDINNAGLNGAFTVSAAGTDFKVFVATPDLTTEGVETFVITLDNVVPLVRTTVNILDTSQSTTPPTYSLNANVSQVNEGGSVRFTLVTTNVPNLAQIPYTITGTGITAADVGTAVLTGRFIINSSGIGVVDIPIVADQVAEGIELLTVTLNDNPSVSASVTINDTSSAPTQGSYALSANKTEINEGETVTFTLTTVNVNAGALVPYNIQGISSNDIGGQPLTGNFFVNQQGVAQVSLTFSASADQTTEGDETMTMRLTGMTDKFASVKIKDTSKTPIPEYSLTYARVGVPSWINTPTKQTINQWYRRYLGRDADEEGVIYYSNSIFNGTMTQAQVESTIATSQEAAQWDGIQRVSEGQSVDIFLTTANVAAGSQIPYTISGAGITSADISNAPLTGNFTIAGTFAAGTANIRLAINADRLTESVETLKLALNGITPEVSTSFDIVDLSIAQGFTLSANPPTSVNEGSTVKITLTSVGYRNGTVVPFVISGANINNGDLTSTKTGFSWNATTSQFTGSFTINNNTDFIDLNITADATPEGAELFTLTVTSPTATASTSITINDTSVEMTGTAVLSDVRQVKMLSLLPKNKTWVAFKMIGAGGSGGGPDGQPTGGYGYTKIENEAWCQFLNDYGVYKEGVGTVWSSTFQVYFPATGSYGFSFSTDNSGRWYLDGDASNAFNWSSFTSVGFTTRNVTAGMHNVTVDLNSPDDTSGVALLIQYGATFAGEPNAFIIWETASLALNGGGAGGPGAYVEGVARLPETTQDKFLFGGIGEPGLGGASGNQKGFSEIGGIGYGFASSYSSSAGTAVASSANGGAGGQEGPGGSSGAGGAGGGATSLFYGAAGTTVDIAMAGGGGGGGGGSYRTGPVRRNNANDPSNSKGVTTYASTTFQQDGGAGQNCPGDGGGGGGGGGGAGTGGAFGGDGSTHGEGGGAGWRMRNTTQITEWNEWNTSLTTKQRESWPTGGVMFPEGVLQPLPWIQFGRGGPGARPWPFGNGGVRGAIGLYWTTNSTPPTLSQVPQWMFPLGSCNLPDVSSPTGVVFYEDGTGQVGADGANNSINWYSLAPSNGIGEFFEFMFTTLEASSGGTNKIIESSAIEGLWQPIFSYGKRRPFYVRAGISGKFDVNIKIRRRIDNTVVADRTYRDITGAAPAGGGGGCCVVATALTGNGKWIKGEKEDLIEWCERKLHGNVLGETFRRGYQVIGSKLVVPQIKKGGFMSKYWNWGFTNAARSVQGKKFNPISVPNTLFWAVWAMVIGSVVSKEFATRCWTSLYKDKKNGNDHS